MFFEVTILRPARDRLESTAITTNSSGEPSDSGGDERNGDGYDFCRHEWVNMNNEGILLVLVGKNWRAWVQKHPKT